jgi:hypothetical protein
VESVEEVYERLEEDDVMPRTDRDVVPTMMKGGTASLRELEQLRRIENVVRLGHVVRVELDQIILEQGSIPTSPDHLHVHCTASGLSDNPTSTDLHRRHGHASARDACGSDVVGCVARLPRIHGEDDGREEHALPADGHAPHAVRLPALRSGRDQHGDAVARSTGAAGVGRSRATQPPEWPGRERGPRGRPRAPGPFLRRAVPALDKLQVFAAQATPRERARIFEPAASVGA